MVIFISKQIIYVFKMSGIEIGFKFYVYFFLCLLVRNAMCTLVYVTTIRAAVRDA